MTMVYIHAPTVTAKRAIAVVCHDCKKRTRILCFFTPYYGWNSTCIKCGREYADGAWQPLPFARSSRTKNIEQAKKMWRALPPVTKNHYGI